jgi:GrpB-like predicted nucleotidyltransferase (UPF0157 family)
MIAAGAHTPADEEYLRAHTLGDLGPLSARIRVVDYDSNWPLLFEGEEKRIRSILGGRALRIEHVGSTSVPGLAAKTVIDILLVVGDAAKEDAYVPALEQAGYRLRIREPEWYEHRLCKGPDTDINLHIFSEGCPETGRMLAFRDWLRNEPGDRERYEGVKRELALRDWKYTQNYADAKTNVIEEILTRARAAKAGA